MKILLVHHSAMIGGGTISALDVAKMLRALGHEVVFAAPRESEILTTSCSAINVKLDVVGTPPLYTYHNASTNGVKCFCKYIYSYIKQKNKWHDYILSVNPDIVILNSVTQAPLIRIVKDLGIKTICTVRETYRERGSWVFNQMLRSMVSKAEAALYLTKFDKKQWATHNAIQEVLPDVVDEDRYIKHTESQIMDFKITHGLDPKIHYLLYLGGIAYAKGAKDLLEAYNRVVQHNKNVGLILVGNPHKEKMNFIFRFLNYREYKYRKECHSFIEKFKDNCYPVKEVGLVADTSYWYESSSAIVFPVKMVHQPRPAYEAGYYQKPIILPGYDNFRDYLINGSNGMLYNIDDINSLAKKIEMLMSSNSLVSR